MKLAVKREQLATKQAKLTQGLKEQGRLQSKMENLEKLLGTSQCPTCGQELESDRRAQLGAALGALQVDFSRIGDDTNDLLSVSAQIAELNKIRGVSARDRLADIDKDTKTAEVALQRVENDIERLREEIAGQDTAELARKRVLQQDALKQEGWLSNSIAKVRNDIGKIKEELAVIQKAIASLAPARSQRSTVKVTIAAEVNIPRQSRGL